MLHRCEQQMDFLNIRFAHKWQTGQNPMSLAEFFLKGFYIYHL